jgi:hypothetical protein
MAISDVNESPDYRPNISNEAYQICAPSEVHAICQSPRRLTTT